MPTFNNVEVSAYVDVDFEVYCGTCGEGLCSESDTRNSRNRNYLQVTVNACPKCIAKKEEEINELRELLSEAREEIDRLQLANE